MTVAIAVAAVALLAVAVIGVRFFRRGGSARRTRGGQPDPHVPPVLCCVCSRPCRTRAERLRRVCAECDALTNPTPDIYDRRRTRHA